MDLAQVGSHRPRLTPLLYARSEGHGLPPEAPADMEASLPALGSLYNWCVLDGCKAVLKSGKLFTRQGLHGHYKHVSPYIPKQQKLTLCQQACPTIPDFRTSSSIPHHTKFNTTPPRIPEDQPVRCLHYIRLLCRSYVAQRPIQPVRFKYATTIPGRLGGRRSRRRHAFRDLVPPPSSRRQRSSY